MKMRAGMLGAVFVASLGLLVTAPPVLAAPTPTLKLTATSQPTNFAPGAEANDPSPLRRRPQYSFIATNVGSAPTSGPITFINTLPPGLTPTGPAARDFNFSKLGSPLENPAISCGVVGQTVTCTDPEPLKPGQWAQFYVPVKVAISAGPMLVNEASVSGGGAGEARAAVPTTVSESLPAFEFLAGRPGFSLAATDTEGGAETEAGTHPYQLTVDLGFPSAEIKRRELYSAGGHLRDLRVTLPRGMVANPKATPVRCSEAQLEGPQGCPPASQVGVVTALTDTAGATPTPSAIYNMVPPPGTAAEFGFNALNVGIFVHLMGGVNSAGEYELASDTRGILARELNPILGAQAQLWGNPSDPSHDAMRGDCLISNGTGLSTCEQPAPRLDVPFLTMPGSCRASLSAAAQANSWEEPTLKVGRGVDIEDPLGASTPTEGCDQLEFDPAMTAQPTSSRSDSPTGLDVRIQVPQTTDFQDRATANIKDVRVAFPAGLEINPSSANGRDACSAAQIGMTSAIGQTPIRFSANPDACPDAAKIGLVEVGTPLLDDPLPGALYVAKPFDNPFGSLLAAYITIDDPRTGVVAKLAGRVQADPVSGQITTVFSENPELPIEDVEVSLFGGPRATLKTPLACGTHSTAFQITPWSAPAGKDVFLSDSFGTSIAAGPGGCPASEAAAPNTPAFSAGTVDARAGAYSPFVLRLSREDGSQRFAAIDGTLPKGLVARLAGVPYCPEAAIAAAKAREAPNQGALEQAAPSCPVSSEVGTVVVGAGAGPMPFHVQGRAYLGGPYKGAPLSLVVITPAVAGPFDLGAVVVRTALYINSETTQVHPVSDPLPTIQHGIPLDLRTVALKVDRPSFARNPTSCEPMRLDASTLSAVGHRAVLSTPFQVEGCRSLKFAPKLSLSLRGGTRRTKHPALKAVLTYPKGSYANIARAQVTLPHAEFLDQSHIGTICTRVQFAADACPRASIYGFARATTPLLDEPIKGPVYLRSSSHKLPDLVAALDGQVDVDLVGRVDTGRDGGIRNTFEAVPDAPVSKFVLEMQGGNKGLLINSENLCSNPQRALANFTAHNGLVVRMKPRILNDCGKKAGKGGHRKRR